MKMISADRISFSASVTEDEIRERMAMEVLEQIGGLDQGGKPMSGIKWSVRRGNRGGYSITIEGPAPARLSLPAPTGDPE